MGIQPISTGTPTPTRSCSRRLIKLEVVESGDPLVHARMVLHKLADAFGLKITPLKLADARPVLEDNIAGLTARDTVALFECGPHPAVSPANCDSSPTTAEVPEVRRAVVMPPTSRPARGALGRGDWRHLPVAGEHVTAISREPTFV